jgi:hypothetical protein
MFILAFGKVQFEYVRVCCTRAGPGCSSLGVGAMAELGPFRVNPDGKTLSRNRHSWNDGT